MFLDNKLDLQVHTLNIFIEVNKKIGLLRKFQHILPISHLLTIHKPFTRSHLDPTLYFTKNTSKHWL